MAPNDSSILHSPIYGTFMEPYMILYLGHSCYYVTRCLYNNIIICYLLGIVKTNDVQHLSDRSLLETFQAVELQTLQIFNNSKRKTINIITRPNRRCGVLVINVHPGSFVHNTFIIHVRIVELFETGLKHIPK